MSDRTESYDVRDDATVVVNLPSGDIRFKQGEPGRVEVRLDGTADALAGVDIDATADTVTVQSTAKKRRWFGGSVDALVTLPVGSDVVVHSGAGDVSVGLQVKELEIHTGAGDVRADTVSGVCAVKIGSGDVRLANLEGTARIASGAGDVRVDKATELSTSTAAGDVYIGEITETARIKSATGDIRIRKFAGSDLEIKTMSGDAGVGLVRGMLVNAEIKTLSGKLRNRVKPSDGEKIGKMNLVITSFSGDVTLRTAK